ncbi:hypothetical protein GGX14DRAFT_522670 [Mycena pura]|uniref:NADAR domain-containing protein n=1 Tax=Mycena pura TaxID=153505 RepID=A0AAD6VBI6_9AGAR|nr:hypothetical protein GGX14DRAFT_522670 [Mycena pura]
MPRTLSDAKDYTFFWGTDSASGWASQWYKAPFTATVSVDGVDQEITFPSNEHWMMLHKALLFSDFDVAKKVLSIGGTSKQDMKYVKGLGRQVKQFKEDVWVQHRERIVTEGTIHKFRQNADLREKLFATGETMLVEASPYDRIWGIGYREANALSGSAKWGLNLLGKALVEARRVLREEEEEEARKSKAEVKSDSD